MNDTIPTYTRDQILLMREWQNDKHARALPFMALGEVRDAVNPSLNPCEAPNE